MTKKTAVHQQDPAPYAVGPADDEAIIAQALRILDARMRAGPVMDSPRVVKDYLRLHFAAASAAGREEFAVMFLAQDNRLIEAKTLFRGTLAQTSVYPREVVKEALTLNAAAVVLAHNHPSGGAEPSRADEYLTQALKSALQLVDVRVLDHVVVGDTCVSFAERGLL
ncbi:MAG: DNA repair protein RadC [Burkholderiaceae bacterium]|nr:DNA repair protein RadC [Burkholderiaceae bacterium]